MTFSVAFCTYGSPRNFLGTSSSAAVIRPVLVDVSCGVFSTARWADSVASSYPIVFVSVPISSIQTRTTSPALRNSRLAMPTPAGVPVRMRSPG